MCFIKDSIDQDGVIFIDWLVVLGLALYFSIMSIVIIRLLKHRSKVNTFENVSLLLSALLTMFIIEIENPLKLLFLIVTFIFLVIFISMGIYRNHNTK